MMRSTAWFILAFAVFCVGHARANSEMDRSAALSECIGSQLDRIIKGKQYEKKRRLGLVLRAFGDSFAHELRSLGPDDKALDLGCGEACAISEYQNGYAARRATDDEATRADLEAINSKPRSERATVTGITYSYDEKKPNVRVLQGRLFEDIPIGEIGRQDLIWDYNGVLSYTKTFSDDLQKALNVLNPNRSLYLFLGQMKEFERSTVTLPGGRKVGLIDWIKGLPGVQVDLVQSTRAPTISVQAIRDMGYSTQYLNRQDTYLRIRRVSDKPVRLPILKIVSAEPAARGFGGKVWPTRVRHFQQTGRIIFGRYYFGK